LGASAWQLTSRRKSPNGKPFASINSVRKQRNCAHFPPRRRCACRQKRPHPKPQPQLRTQVTPSLTQTV
jgi:hypothetical protein